MAQRTSLPGQKTLTVGWVKKPKQEAIPPLNDNQQGPLSGLRFQERKARLKRADDLSWQTKFALMKLHHWRDLDNSEWDPLDRYLKAARAELGKLGPI